MTKRVFSLDGDGYFTRRGRPFVPLGVNYWPASCGAEMWRAWPADEIRRDLKLIRELGLNTVRFFLRWQDFEPAPGRYRPSAFRRLDQFLAWCGSAALLTRPMGRSEATAGACSSKSTFSSRSRARRGDDRPRVGNPPILGRGAAVFSGAVRVQCGLRG